jgi:hypothetical protein
MSTVTPQDQNPVEGIHPGSTEEHTMSSHLHAELVRARQRVAATAAGLILASGVAGIYAAEHTQTSIASPTSTPAIHTGATSRVFAARIRQLEARGYVQTACTTTGALMFNPRTHRTVNVRA